MSPPSSLQVGLLGQDSDFFVLPTPRYLVLESLRLHDNNAPPVVAAYPRAAVVKLMGLPSPLMPMVASLIGNDFVSQACLLRPTAALLTGYGPTYY